MSSSIASVKNDLRPRPRRTSANRTQTSETLPIPITLCAKMPRKGINMTDWEEKKNAAVRTHYDSLTARAHFPGVFISLAELVR